MSPADARDAGPRLDPSRIARLARKELRETLRDRRTILTLVLMPLLVYPLLGLTFRSFLLTQAAAADRDGRTEYVIGFEDATAAAELKPFLDEAERLGDGKDDAAGRSDAAGFRALWPDEGQADVAALVREGMIDLGIRFRREATEQAPTAEIDLVFNPGSAFGRDARREIEGRLRAVNERRLRDRLREAGVSAEPPLDIRGETVESPPAAAVTLAAVLPLILLLMTVTGAVYPAIDLTAGERERGTLETLIASPAPRSVLLLAKYAAVLAVAVLTAGMNLVAMTATAYSLGLDALLFGGGVTAAAVAQVVGLLVVLAAFFSAVLLLVTSFARSFKEAQAYLIPLMLVALAPGILSLMPDLPLTLPLAVAPLAGIVLVARDLLAGTADPVLVAASVVATALYAAGALLAASRVFGTDAVLFGSPGTWSELFRRPESERLVPPVAVGAATLAAVCVAYVLLAPLPGRLEGLGTAGRLAASALVTAFLFFAFPLAAAAMSRSGFRSTFRLRRPAPAAIAGAVVLGFTLWPFAYELELAVLSRERVEALRRLFEPIRGQLGDVPLGVLWLTLAVAPAVCEEWFFRGFLLSSLRGRAGSVVAALLSAAIFGAFHVLVRDGVLFERFVPSAFLGLVLAAVCIRTGSLWPGVVLHALHNGLLLTLAAYEQELARSGWNGGEGTHLPATWLLAAAGGAAVGGLLIRAGRSDDGRAERPL